VSDAARRDIWRSQEAYWETREEATICVREKRNTSIITICRAKIIGEMGRGNNHQRPNVLICLSAAPPTLRQAALSTATAKHYSGKAFGHVLLSPIDRQIADSSLLPRRKITLHPRPLFPRFNLNRYSSAALAFQLCFRRSLCAIHLDGVCDWWTYAMRMGYRI
jgi:hypothetical protein